MLQGWGLAGWLGFHSSLACEGTFWVLGVSRKKNGAERWLEAVQSADVDVPGVSVGPGAQR